MIDAEFVLTKDCCITLEKSGHIVQGSTIRDAVIETNRKFHDLKESTTRVALDLFDVIDFRMLSGMVGETLVVVLASLDDGLAKNPNIDGYPDLLDVSTEQSRKDFEDWSITDIGKFIRYPHGGIEVKNTFGTKKARADLVPRGERISHVNSKPDWKAHHQYTNHLLAIFSDYLDGCPRIVSAMYSDQLKESDWKGKQNPKAGSTMTSFSVIEKTGWEKLKAGLLLCQNDPKYIRFFRGGLK